VKQNPNQQHLGSEMMQQVDEVVNHISLLTGKNAQDQVKTSIAFRALA
jgi:hypothetical protein